MFSTYRLLTMPIVPAKTTSGLKSPYDLYILDMTIFSSNQNNFTHSPHRSIFNQKQQKKTTNENNTINIDLH